MKKTWYGYHTRDVPEFSMEDKILSEKLFFVQGLLYNPVLGLIKWSIIIFLMRLDDKRKSVRWVLWALWIFNLAHMISVFLVVIFQCTPVDMYWNHYKSDKLVDGIIVNQGYHCIDQASFSLITAAISVLTDIAILLVPIAIMWNLRMALRRKLAVAFVLSLGWVVAVVGMIRIKFFVDFWYGNFPDPSWSLWNTLSGVENNVAIMVSCGPALKAIISRLFPHLFGSLTKPRQQRGLYQSTEGYELSRQPDQQGSVVVVAGTQRARFSPTCTKACSTDAIVRNMSFDGYSDTTSEPQQGLCYQKGFHRLYCGLDEVIAAYWTIHVSSSW